MTNITGFWTVRNPKSLHHGYFCWDFVVSRISIVVIFIL